MKKDITKIGDSFSRMHGLFIIYSYTGNDNLIVRPLAPPPRHTSDSLIFKISFDYENLGKLMRYSEAISVVLHSKTPLTATTSFGDN